MPPGGDVWVSLDGAGGEARLAAGDSGKGIGAEELPHIFTRCYRVSGVEKHSSTGLGLSIAAELTRLHHGSIEMESRLGQGTVFTLRLPLWTG